MQSCAIATKRCESAEGCGPTSQLQGSNVRAMLLRFARLGQNIDRKIIFRQFAFPYFRPSTT